MKSYKLKIHYKTGWNGVPKTKQKSISFNSINTGLKLLNDAWMVVCRFVDSERGMIGRVYMDGSRIDN